MRKPNLTEQLLFIVYSNSGNNDNITRNNIT